MIYERFPLAFLADVVDCFIDYRGKTPPKTTTGIRLITAKVVKDGRILAEPKEYIASDFYNEWMRRGLPQPLDVLITTEAPLGEVAIIRDTERIALAQRIILLRSKHDVLDPSFLYYALQSTFTRAELQSRASGTTVSGIKQSELRRVRIPLPELAAQWRIAEVLNTYDQLIEIDLRRIQILENMARAIYREWFAYFRSQDTKVWGRLTHRLGLFRKVGSAGLITSARSIAMDWTPAIFLTSDSSISASPPSTMDNCPLRRPDLRSRAPSISLTRKASFCQS